MIHKEPLSFDKYSKSILLPIYYIFFMASGANFDDYYAQVSSPSQEHGDSKTSGSKLKIKAKKPVEAGTPAESVEVAPVSPVTEKKVVQTFVPTITFEAAPKIVVGTKGGGSSSKRFSKCTERIYCPKRKFVRKLQQNQSQLDLFMMQIKILKFVNHKLREYLLNPHQRWWSHLSLQTLGHLMQRRLLELLK